MRRSALLLLLPLALVLAACGDDEPTTTQTAPAADAPAAAPPAPNRLEGRTFVSTKVTGRDLVPGTEVVLIFKGGLLSAQAGCNTIRAPYAVTGDRLQLTQTPSTTSMHCEPLRLKQDAWLTRVLKANPRFAAHGTTLTLTGDRAKLVLVEGRPHGTPPPVTGTKWILVRTGDRKTKTKLPAGVQAPTLRLTEGGKANVFAGCNTGGGTVEVGEDGFLTFGPIALTRMLCDEAANTVEHTVTSVLDGRAAFGYEGEDLVITKDGTHLLYAPD
jgi:heat shock protein HslJ